MEPTADQKIVFDRVSALAAELWESCKGIEGRTDDPKILSTVLFARLWSNHRAYALLWQNGMNLEADIILRSGLEAAICIAANAKMDGGLFELLRLDAAFTIRGQSKLQAKHGNNDVADAGAEVLRNLLSELPTGTKPKSLIWEDLAEIADLPLLYALFRSLSGTSTHITGLSIITHLTDLELSQSHETLAFYNRRVHFVMMAGATLQGTLVHAGLLGEHGLHAKAIELIKDLDVVSIDILPEQENE